MGRGNSYAFGVSGPDTYRGKDPQSDGLPLVPDWHWQFLAEGQPSR
jgi:hypothetical protein